MYGLLGRFGSASRTCRTLLFAAMLLLASSNLSCTGPGSAVSIATSQCPSNIHVKNRASLNSITWIVAATSIALLLRAGASRALVYRAFNNSRSYVYAATPSGLGVPTAYYTSYAEIEEAVKAGKLPGRFKAVIYDNERWQGTPVAEQRNPARYERLAGRLLRRHNLMYAQAWRPQLWLGANNRGPLTRTDPPDDRPPRPPVRGERVPAPCPAW
jgi:hypothetical protein